MLLAGWLAACCVVRADSIFEEPRDFPFVAGAYGLLPDAGLDGPLLAAKADAKENRLALGIMRLDQERFQLDFGLDYQYTRYTYERVAGRNRDLHRLQLPIGFRHEGDEWMVTAHVAPGIATSSNVMKDIFERGSGEDYFVSAHLEGLKARSARLGWLIGAAVDRAFGASAAYPVLGLFYRPDRRLTYRLALPDPALTYAPSPRARLALRLFPAGFRWHVVSDELVDDFDYEVEGWRLRGTWSRRFGKAFWLDLAVGYEFDRRHEFVDDTGQRIDAELDSEWLLSVGLRWRNGPLPYVNEAPR